MSPFNIPNNNHISKENGSIAKENSINSHRSHGFKKVVVGVGDHHHTGVETKET